MMTSPSLMQEALQRPNVYGDTYIYGTGPVHMGNIYTTETATPDGIGQNKGRTKQELDYRFHNVNDAISNTCRWCLNHKLYQEWKTTKSHATSERLLWLRGKPGSGKSTIMKQAIIDARSERSVLESQPGRTSLVACFFFNARGSRLESTIQGFFQSILLQALENEDLALDEEPLKTFVRKHFLRASAWEWTVAELQTLFRLSVAPLPLDLVLYIDALDECDSATNRDLVDFLYEYLENMRHTNATLKVCISSRHYPNIHRLDCRRIVVEEHNSPGIFLWAVIVIGRLRESIENGERRSKSLQLLSSVPKDLRKLFESLLSSILEDEDQKESLLLLLFVLCAKRPLELPELNLALAFVTRYKSQAEYRRSPDYLSDDQLRRLIVKRSRGLIEIVQRPKRYDGFPYSKPRSVPDVVQFLHTSVKDFLLEHSDLVLPQVQSGRAMLAFASDQLARSCFNFLRISDMCDYENVAQYPQRDCRHPVRHGHHPLYRYICEYAFEHAKEAEFSGIPQMHVAEALNLTFSSDSKSRDLPFELCVQLWKSKYSNPMTVCAYYQLLCIFKALPMPASPDLINALHLDQALGVAISLGYETVTNELVSRGVSLTPNSRALVYGAVNFAKIHILEIFLKMGGDPEAQGEYGSALNLAASIGKTEHVRALLRYNAKVCVSDPAFGHALLSASSEGHAQIVKILLDHGASIALRGKYKWGFHALKDTHALEEASYWDHQTVLSILLRVAERDRIDEEYYRDAYSAATRTRSVECARLLGAAAEKRGFGSGYSRPWYLDVILPWSQKKPIPRGEITVYVKTLFNKTKSVVVREHSHGIVLKQAACENGHRWLLSPSKRRVEDEERLCDMGICNGSTVHEVLPFRARTYWTDDVYAIERALRLSLREN